MRTPSWSAGVVQPIFSSLTHEIERERDRNTNQSWIFRWLYCPPSQILSSFGTKKSRRRRPLMFLFHIFLRKIKSPLFIAFLSSLRSFYDTTSSEKMLLWSLPLQPCCVEQVCIGSGPHSSPLVRSMSLETWRNHSFIGILPSHMIVNAHQKLNHYSSMVLFREMIWRLQKYRSRVNGIG